MVANASSSSDRVALIRRVRGRSSVVYEIDHGGTPLSIGMAPTEDEHGVQHWSLEATCASLGGAVVKARELTRAGALTTLARNWAREADARQLPELDWGGITSLLTNIRAV